MRIMIVDDNPRFRRTLCSLLAHLATEIVEAEDSDAAVALYKHFHPDIVLMDVLMPSMDGLEATACIRAIDTRARIVILAEYDDPSLRLNAEFVGASGYYLKENLKNLRDFLERLSVSRGFDSDTSLGVLQS